MSLYLVEGKDEVLRRRGLLPPGQVAEAWADHQLVGAFWLGEESKRLLDAAGEPLPAALVLPDDSVPIFYGPRLCDIESLPREESVRTRALSARGMAVAWITLDRFGERVSYEPTSPADPIFHLRRPGGGASHVWRRFETRRDAIDFMREAYGEESEAFEWAQTLAVPDFETLLRRFVEKGA